jgi:hypothetical protein
MIENDIDDFLQKESFLKSFQWHRDNFPISDMQRSLAERTALYLEFMAAAFLKETGLKASECELVNWFDPVTETFHWEYRKKIGDKK